MLNDLPSRDDSLGRRPFADSIARIIANQSDPAPQVIAIDGAWGDGKTTVFGFLKDALKGKNLKVMDFNPWRYGDEETMIRVFVLELAKELGVKLLNKREQLVETVQDRADWFNAAAKAVGAEKVGGFFHFSFKRLRVRIEELVNRLKGELNSHAQRVTVLVDDPDRLELQQLMALFRLIKLIADMEWLTFVLAMDCEAVIRTIGRQFGGEDEGRRFLEKIVQVPIRLPAVPHIKLSEFALRMVQQVLDDLKVQLDQSEVVRFRRSFDAVLMPLIKTPRTAKQFANVVRFSLGLLPGEVNPVDVMILEGMRLFAREVFDNVKEHLIPKAEPHWLDDSVDRDDEKSDAFLKKLLEGVQGEVSKAWRSTLIMLFPAKLSGAIYGEDEFLSWTDDKRVACIEYFIRYLAAVVPENDLPDAEITRWMEFAQAGDVNLLISEIGARLNPLTEEILVQKLQRIQRHLSGPQRANFAIAVAKLSNLLVLRERARQGDVAFGQSAIFAAQCVSGQTDLEAETLAIEVIENASSSGMWAIEFFWFLPHARRRNGKDVSDEQQVGVLTKEASSKIERVLADRLMNEIENSVEPPRLDFLRRVFNISVRLGDTARLSAWSKRELIRNPGFITNFASLAMTWYYSDEERQMEWPGDEKVLETVKSYVDVKWLAQTFSPDPPSKSNGWRHYISGEEAAYQLVQLLKNANQSEINADGS